ncbi:MAG TPA: GntR family transcriptional regulator [Ramlibacter sp.]|jgi:DNA-binding GntR family transcriptional regulator
MDINKRKTRAEHVKEQLAQAIVSGEILPGMTLDEGDIAGRYGVSRTPVREAIRDLAAMGLVQVRPHRGTIVTRPEPQQLAHMFEIMAELEGLCAGRAARCMSIGERQELERVHASLGKMVRDNDIASYRVANEEFHSTIYKGSHNRYLIEITLTTRRRLSPFRRAQFMSTGRLAQSYAEHDSIVSAIMRADEASASAAMRSHILVVENTFEQMSFVPA